MGKTEREREREIDRTSPENRKFKRTRGSADPLKYLSLSKTDENTCDVTSLVS